MIIKIITLYIRDKYNKISALMYSICVTTQSITKSHSDVSQQTNTKTVTLFIHEWHDNENICGLSHVELLCRQFKNNRNQ